MGTRCSLYMRTRHGISSTRRFSRVVLRHETRAADEYKSDTSFGLDLKTRPAHAGQQAPLSTRTESCVPVEKLMCLRSARMSRMGLALSVTVDALINTLAINAVMIFAREPIGLECY